MKLTDFLSDVGRVVAYYPSLRRITGSTNATIFLCQLIYWKGKESDPNGWIYKESDEIEKETGLSYGEQKTARRVLIEAGLIEEHYARLEHQMKFRLNLDVINERWGNGQTSVPESGKPQLGNEQKPHSLIESEITTENTTQEVSKKEIPQNMPIDWYIQHGYPVPAELIENNQLEAAATSAFESKLGFGSLPWDSTSEWTTFKKWVMKIHKEDATTWQRYAEWRADKGKYDAMSNKQIRQNPKMFIDTGYPAFMAHSVMVQQGGRKPHAL